MQSPNTDCPIVPFDRRTIFASVTLFGIVDTDVAPLVAAASPIAYSYPIPAKQTFWLEAGLNSDNGTGQPTNTNNQASGAALAGLSGGQGFVFARRAAVNLAGGWGELRLGRDYTPQYWNLYFADPFGNEGVGLPMPATYLFGGFTGPTAVRSSKGISSSCRRISAGFSAPSSTAWART